MRLKSDFIDYYDHHFDLDGDVFSRLSTEGMDKLGQLKYMKKLGYPVPPFNKVKKLHATVKTLGIDFQHQLDVVVYTDIKAHKGEGKIKMPLSQAITEHPNEYASIYITSDRSGLSWRLLQVGDIKIYLEYSSNDWRSNYGDVKIKVLEIERDAPHKIKLPLFAIDCVPGLNSVYAVDFNVSPQLRGTGLEEILPAEEVVNALRKAVGK